MKPLTAWQSAAALATEGACLLPYLLAVLGGLLGLTRPPYYFPVIPAAWQPVLPTAVAALLYGAAHAPLCLWRTAYYVRLCAAEGSLPSLRPTRRGFAALGWRWRLWWRRATALTLACAPSALLFTRGTLALQQSAAVQPILWLAAGAAAMLLGLTAVAVWQCRFCLAPFFLLRGYPAAAAMPFSARAMRGHVGEYVNFLGGELPRLSLCLLLIPATWIVPAFHRRRAALLLSFMPPDR